MWVCESMANNSLSSIFSGMISPITGRGIGAGLTSES
jgi:hypothetical protein